MKLGLFFRSWETVHCSSFVNLQNYLRGGPKKWGHKLMAIILSNLNRFSHFFSGKFTVQWLLHLTIPCICCHTTSWNNVRKQATNDKLQGLVATYLRCGGVVNNQINNDLLLSLSVKKYLKSVNIWQSYTQERGCPVHYVRLCTAKSAHETTMFLLVTLPNIHWLTFFSLADSAMNLC